MKWWQRLCEKWGRVSSEPLASRQSRRVCQQRLCDLEQCGDELREELMVMHFRVEELERGGGRREPDNTAIAARR